MKVYIDLVIILNIWIDFLLLLATSLILKRRTSIVRLIVASMVGSLSTFLLFFKVNHYLLIVLKLFISIVMLIISFSFKNIKSLSENIIYFYLVGIILAGFIYLAKSKYNINNFETNFLLLSFITPLSLYVYYKNTKKIDNHYNQLYNVDLYYDNQKYTFVAYLDTGNKLYDQYKKRPIILVYTNKIEFNYEKGILVPFETASGKSVLKCLQSEKIIIDNKIVRKNVIFALAQDSFKINDVNMILHSDLMGG